MFIASYRNTMAGAKFPPKAVAKPAQSQPKMPKARPAEDAQEYARRLGLNQFRRRGMPQWAMEIVEHVAFQHCVGIDQIASGGRFRRIVRARDEAIYRVKEAKPVTSTPVLGKWFDRDHTSVLYSLSAHSERSGDPSLTKYQLSAARRRMAAFKRWQKIKAEGSSS